MRAEACPPDRHNSIVLPCWEGLVERKEDERSSESTNPAGVRLPGSFRLSYLTTVVAVAVSTSGSTSAMVAVQVMVPLVVGV